MKKELFDNTLSKLPFDFSLLIIGFCEKPGPEKKLVIAKEERYYQQEGK